MWNLLQANIARLRKSWVFWLCAAVLVYFAWDRGMYEMAFRLNMGQNTVWDRWSFTLFGRVWNLLPLVATVFAALFLGGEYDGSAIRNKLIPGHGRGAVYCAAMLTVILGILLLFLLYTGGTAVFLWAAYGPFPDYPWADAGAEPIGRIVLEDLAAILVMWVAWGGLFTAIGMNCPVPAVSVVVSLGVYGLLLLLGNEMDPILMQNQTGLRAKLSPFLYNFLPTGQGDQLRTVLNHGRLDLIPYGLLFTVVVNGIGAFVFCKKDMR